jgi:hypothetical protein
MENIFSSLRASDNPVVGSDATTTQFPASCKKYVASDFAATLKNVTPFRFDENTYGRIALL